MGGIVDSLALSLTSVCGAYYKKWEWSENVLVSDVWAKAGQMNLSLTS